MGNPIPFRCNGNQIDETNGTWAALGQGITRRSFEKRCF